MYERNCEYMCMGATARACWANRTLFLQGCDDSEYMLIATETFKSSINFWMECLSSMAREFMIVTFGNPAIDLGPHNGFPSGSCCSSIICIDDLILLSLLIVFEDIQNEMSLRFLSPQAIVTELSLPWCQLHYYIILCIVTFILCISSEAELLFGMPVTIHVATQCLWLSLSEIRCGKLILAWCETMPFTMAGISAWTRDETSSLEEDLSV